MNDLVNSYISFLKKKKSGGDENLLISLLPLFPKEEAD